MEKFIGNCEPGDIHGSHVIQLNTKLRREARSDAAAHGGTVKGYLHGKFKRGWLVLALRPTKPSPELPEMCVAVLEPDDKLIGIKRGERGYFEMYDGMVTGPAARRVANRINRALEVSSEQREAMLCGSLFGWECPSARPESRLHVKAAPYDEAESMAATQAGDSAKGQP